mmetsp:Transcript_76844/g.220699  ORF Transcript_76844/g.220699 Transcript_76844/m.220699 type:complete len:229 (-) Transcript_76844:81-767(-)
MGMASSGIAVLPCGSNAAARHCRWATGMGMAAPKRGGSGRGVGRIGEGNLLLGLRRDTELAQPPLLLLARLRRRRTRRRGLVLGRLDWLEPGRRRGHLQRAQPVLQREWVGVDIHPYPRTRIRTRAQSVDLEHRLRWLHLLTAVAAVVGRPPRVNRHGGRLRTHVLVAITIALLGPFRLPFRRRLARRRTNRRAARGGTRRARGGRASLPGLAYPRRRGPLARRKFGL